MNIDRFLENVSSWSQSTDHIVATAICGSHASGKARIDSDVDLIIISDDRLKLINETSWLAQFGNVGSIQLEEYGLVRSLRVHYADGLEVEFGIASRDWCSPPIDLGTAQVINDGLCSIHDPEDMFKRAIDSVKQLKL